jgi:hypothetical protein
MSSLQHARRPATFDPVTVASRVWIRNARRTRAWASIAVLWSIVLAGLRLEPGGQPSHMTLAGNLVLGAVYFGLAALGLVLAGRVARAGLWIGPEGIVVRGPFRTHALALDAAGLFAPGLQGAGGNGTPCPMLERHAGPAVGVWALGRRNIWFCYERLCREIEPLCDELNELVETLRSASRN